MPVTDTVEEILKNTTSAVLRRKNGKSWRTLGEELDVPHGVLHAIGGSSYEHVSWLTIRKVRTRLGLHDPGDIIPTLACPDCGEAHAGRCYGKSVVQVVVLGEGERVAKAGRPRNRKKYHRPCMDDATFELWKQFISEYRSTHGDI